MTMASDPVCSNWEALNAGNKKHKLMNKLKYFFYHTEGHFYLQAPSLSQKTPKLMAVQYFFPYNDVFPLKSWLQRNHWVIKMFSVLLKCLSVFGTLNTFHYSNLKLYYSGFLLDYYD